MRALVIFNDNSMLALKPVSRRVGFLTRKTKKQIVLKQENLLHQMVKMELCCSSSPTKCICGICFKCTIVVQWV